MPLAAEAFAFGAGSSTGSTLAAGASPVNFSRPGGAAGEVSPSLERLRRAVCVESLLLLLLLLLLLRSLRDALASTFGAAAGAGTSSTIGATCAGRGAGAAGASTTVGTGGGAAGG